MKHSYAILNTSRWETDTITEWLCYHRSIGFDHAYIYCNDDEPYELYERLLPFLGGHNPFVTFHHFPFQGQQMAMYLHFLQHHKDECEWFMFVDTDEFLALRQDADLPSFMRSREDRLDCIYFNWIWFGPQDFASRPGGSTLKQFLLREDHAFRINYFTKTLSRASSIDVELISRPPEPMLHHDWPAAITKGRRRANVIGDDVDEYFADFPHSAERYLERPGVKERIVETAVTFHYLFRSRADFVRRVERGTGGSFHFQPNWKSLHDVGDIDGFVDSLHRVRDDFLANYWADHVTKAADATRVVPLARHRNLALDGTPLQSSTSPWSNDPHTAVDARGGANGIRTGHYGFHTGAQRAPWWMIDLGASALIEEIRVFNVVVDRALAARADGLVIDLADDFSGSWTVVYRHLGEESFGGIDGQFLRVPLAGRRARFVRLALPGETYLHLDEIEIYGEVADGEVEPQAGGPA